MLYLAEHQHIRPRNIWVLFLFFFDICFVAKWLTDLIRAIIILLTMLPQPDTKLSCFSGRLKLAKWFDGAAKPIRTLLFNGKMDELVKQHCEIAIRHYSVLIVSCFHPHRAGCSSGDPAWLLIPMQNFPIFSFSISCAGPLPPAVMIVLNFIDHILLKSNQ